MIVNPFTGQQVVQVNNNTGFAFDIGDIAFRNDNELFSYSLDTDDPGTRLKDAAQSGNYLQINTGTGAVTNLGDDGIGTYEIDPASVAPMLNPITAHVVGGNRVGYGIQFNAMTFGAVNVARNGNAQRLFAVGNRGEEYPMPNPATGNFLEYRDNIIYYMDPTTGAAAVPGIPRLDGAATDKFEIGRIRTSSELNTVDATTFNVATQTTTRVIQDGDTVMVNDGTGLTTFEFDAGLDYLQTIPLATAPLGAAAANNHIFDGDFFILDRDNDFTNANEALYQFDTGVAINVVQPASNFIDGQGFTVIGCSRVVR